MLLFPMSAKHQAGGSELKSNSRRYHRKMFLTYILESEEACGTAGHREAKG